MDQGVVERVRRASYGTFASPGHAPSRHQIRELAAVDDGQIDEAVAELATQRHLTLDRSDTIVMAHPVHDRQRPTMSAHSCDSQTRNFQPERPTACGGAIHRCSAVLGAAGIPASRSSELVRSICAEIVCATPSYAIFTLAPSGATDSQSPG